MSQKDRISGVLCPVVTPFNPDFSIDIHRFKNHCSWLLSHGAGLAVFGTNSEANSMSVDEKLKVLEELIDSGISPDRLLPGTGCVALPDSILLTKTAVRLGCTGVLMLPPFFYKGVSDTGLFESYAEIIEQVGDPRLKIYLYNIPQFTGIPITLRLVEMLLSRYPDTVVGLKDSSGDWTYAKEMIESFHSDGFDVFPASEAFLAESVPIGGKGCISATVNINPGGIVSLWKELQADGSHSRQDEVNAVRHIFEKFPMIAALKATIGHYTDDPSWRRVRPPLDSLSDEQLDMLTAELHETGFKMDV